jgi:ABC-2 type transport system permease protein
VAGHSHGIDTGDVGAQLPRVLAGALVQVPAAWVLGAVALVFVGLAPRLAVLSWAALVAVLLLEELGEILHLPRWVLDLSPFTHVPKLPGSDASAGPLIALTVVAAGLSAAGFAGLRRRDLG